MANAQHVVLGVGNIPGDGYGGIDADRKLRHVAERIDRERAGEGDHPGTHRRRAERVACVRYDCRICSDSREIDRRAFGRHFAARPVRAVPHSAVAGDARPDMRIQRGADRQDEDIAADGPRVIKPTSGRRELRAVLRRDSRRLDDPVLSARKGAAAQRERNRAACGKRQRGRGRHEARGVRCDVERRTRSERKAGERSCLRARHGERRAGCDLDGWRDAYARSKHRLAGAGKRKRAGSRNRAREGDVMAAVVNRRAVFAHRHRHILRIWNERRVVGRGLQRSAVDRNSCGFGIAFAGAIVDKAAAAYDAAAGHVYRGRSDIVVANVYRHGHDYFAAVDIELARTMRADNQTSAVSAGAGIFVLAAVLDS